MSGHATDNPFLTEEFSLFFRDIGNSFIYRNSDSCRAYIYQRKVNLFSFAASIPKFHLTLPILGLPASIELSGIEGTPAGIRDLFRKVSEQLPFMLVLNSAEPFLTDHILWEHTLPNILFTNRFETFEHYLASLRSDYRNRIRKIFKRTSDYAVNLAGKSDFSSSHYQLYEKTYQRSRFPLEKLPPEFFSDFPGSSEMINIRDRCGKLIAFAYLFAPAGKCFFLFGGSESRREYPDLYARLLLEILKEGISRGCREISFGQTAEDIKLKLGGIAEPRYAGLWIRAALLRKGISFIKKHLSYDFSFPEYRVYKPT